MVGARDQIPEWSRADFDQCHLASGFDISFAETGREGFPAAHSTVSKSFEGGTWYFFLEDYQVKVFV